MDRLESMRVFQRVVDEGSFAAAARALDLSPAVVTRRIADLEAHLSVRLLHRTTRRLSLTPAGAAYLERVRGILRDIDELHAMTSADTQELAGVLHILAPPMLATHMLAPLLSGFRAAYPRISLEINVNDEPQIEDYDITLLSEESNIDAEHVRRKVITAEAMLVASPAYLKRRGVPRTPHDLTAHDCLRLTLTGKRPGSWRMWPDEHADEPLELDVEPVLWSNHIDTLLRAALDGAGIAATSVELVAPYLVRGDLVRVLAPWITGRVTIYAAFPTRKFMPERTRVFLEYLINETERTAQAARAVLGRVK